MTGARGEYLTTPIADADAKSGFDCGREELNGFFARYAYANDRRGIGRTFVLRAGEGEGLPPVVGFYTLSMAVLEGEKLPRKLRERLPRYPLPVALVGRLAVDVRAKGRGFGDALLADALARAAGVAESIGCFGVIVDAKDEGVVAFYQRAGFATLEATQYPRRMFLPMKTILTAMESKSKPEGGR